ncbi:MAG TPA: methyltransferase [Acidimicrobiales bacterium]|nr:methyltransferase [Acidimicrobiales bacterium]
MTTTEQLHAVSAPNVTADPILRLASGFMAAKHLFAASELGLFEALADAPATLDALTARTGLTRRAARISADAMVALGILERDGDLYRNGPAADRFLAGKSHSDLRPLLRFWDEISYPIWVDFAESLARGPVHEVFELDEEKQAIASAGIEAVLAGPANALGQVVDFSSCQRLLDVGGGTGSWSIATARHHPHLRGTIVELPAVAVLAEQRIAGVGLADRLTVVAADAMADDLPRGHDTVLVANLVHYGSPESNAKLLGRIRAAVQPGAKLLLADFWTDPTHTEPVQAALMAGEFAAHLREGDVYSVEEVRDWLPAAGWCFLDHLPLAGPQSLIRAEAV